VALTTIVTFQGIPELKNFQDDNYKELQG
jgi:hypothetical protein